MLAGLLKTAGVGAMLSVMTSDFITDADAFNRRAGHARRGLNVRVHSFAPFSSNYFSGRFCTGWPGGVGKYRPQSGKPCSVTSPITVHLRNLACLLRRFVHE